MGQEFASIWDAIEDTPSMVENMRLRSELVIQLKQHIKRQGWRQREAAERLGVTQPRISDLTCGRIDLFGLDSLVTMAAAAGLHVEMKIAEVA